MLILKSSRTILFDDMMLGHVPEGSGRPGIGDGSLTGLWRRWWFGGGGSGGGYGAGDRGGAYCVYWHIILCIWRLTIMKPSLINQPAGRLLLVNGSLGHRHPSHRHRAGRRWSGVPSCHFPRRHLGLCRTC